MSTPPTSGKYVDYPSAEDLPAVTLDPVTGLAKAPPPPPDPSDAPSRSQGVQEWGEGGRVITRADGGTFVDTEPVFRSDVTRDAGTQPPPSYATDQPPPKVAAAGDDALYQRMNPTAATGATEGGGDFVTVGDKPRYGSLLSQSQREAASTPYQLLNGCDGSWYDAAIKAAQGAANLSKQSTAKGGNPLCRGGGSNDTRYSMTEWDGIPREQRSPFIITTQYRLENGVPLWPRGSRTDSAEASNSQFLVFRVNPTQLHITQALRGAEAKTRVGTVYYVWQDPLKRTFFDEPTVGITFDSGNILPWTWLNRVNAAGQQNVGGVNLIADPTLDMDVPPGMETFYRFMALLNEGKVMPGGRPNFVYITINTRKFPQLTLAGWFTPEGVGSITDSADDPNHLTWTANFHCRATYPRLYNSGELLQMFQTMARTLPRPLVGKTPPGTNPTGFGPGL